MEFDKLLAERRSIRRYTDQKVKKEDLEAIINATIQAPSWKNSQTHRYHVVTSDEMVKKVREECLPTFNQNNTKDAPVYFVCTFVKDQSGYDKEGTPTNEVGQGWGYYDCGLANENLVLKAKDLGLDTLIMGIRDEKAIREILNIPEEEIIVSVISCGYRDINPNQPARKDVESIAKFY